MPSRCGSAWKLGKLMMVNSGSCGFVSLGSLMNIVRAKSECHASSLITRIGNRYFGSAPTKVSCTNSSRPFAWAVMRSFSALNLSCGKSLFTSPQKTLSSLPGSRTIALSFAERPVCSPVSTSMTPWFESVPSLRHAISS